MGFKIPAGLEKHLEGGGNASRCPVMETIWKLALDQMGEKLDRREQEKKAQEQATKAARRTPEMLWRVDQDEPKLSDELWLEKPRDPALLEVAERRIAQLGFKMSIAGNVKGFVQETDQFIVYADPRQERRITFRVFRKGKPRKKRLGVSTKASI